MRELLTDYLNPVFNLLNYNLFALGDARITPLSIIYLILLSAVLFYVSRKLKELLIKRLLQRTSLDIGAQQAIGTISRYLVLFIGFLIILQTVGINLTTLNVLAGAIGIGIGLGLQNIANNFISGLILLLERPIKIGDRIEVDGIHGQVRSIGARSTTVRTNDNISIIVPNSKFISESVINWSFHGNLIRFKIPVGVAYDSDVDRVIEVLHEVAKDNQDVVDDPAPVVRLMELGDNALIFELRAWSRSQLQRPGVLRSALNLAIVKKFRENGIEIPFPQRDLHFLGGTVSPEANGSGRGEERSKAGETGREARQKER
jgi:small-conductance mechanosensitive channel